jgi:hypothetical protein
VSPLLSPDENLVFQVEDLLGVPVDVLECIEPISPAPEVPVVAVKTVYGSGGTRSGAGVIDAPGSQPMRTKSKS